MKLYPSMFPNMFDEKYYSYPWYFSDWFIILTSIVFTGIFIFLLIKFAGKLT